MNKLDGKCIVDRDIVKMVIDLLYSVCASYSGYERTELHKALAQDNTGWAAVPVEETRQMMDAARQYKNLLTPWGRAYRAMLNASPPLPGGGE